MSLIKNVDILLLFPTWDAVIQILRIIKRGISLNGYIIFYRVTDIGIEILRVVSGYRDYPSLFIDSGDD